jgi:hypothetical protein
MANDATQTNADSTANTDAAEPALSADILSPLETLETTIQYGQESFGDVVAAFAEIHSKKLYRATHSSFESYSRDKWGFSRSHAYRLIDAAEVRGSLSPVGDILPDNEWKCRELKKLPDADRQVAWKTAVERAGEKQPSARIVREAVAEILGASEEPNAPDDDSPDATAAVIDDLRQMQSQQESHQRLIAEMTDTDWDRVEQESSGLLQELIDGSEAITEALSARMADRKDDAPTTSDDNIAERTMSNVPETLNGGRTV